MRKRILILAALLAGIHFSSATVTVQGWWRFGELGDLYGDVSGNGRRFGSAFSRVGSGNAGVGVEPFGCGGPLGTTTTNSTSSLYWTPTHADAAGMWGIGYNPPPTNYVIECWCLPNLPGTLPGNGSWLFDSGSSGGVAFVLTNSVGGNSLAGTIAITAQIIPRGTGQIGDPWVVDTNRWTHLAIVNSNGANYFYVNGIQHGAPSDPSLNTVPAGDVFAGSAPGTQPTYTGLLDELRMSTYAPGAFTTNDLLTRSMAPNITTQPQSVAVWNGGAAPFTVGVALDNSTTYQWQRGGLNIGSGATASEYYLNQVSGANNLQVYDCVLNNYTGIPVTSSNATLTVVNNNPANIASYETAVTAESSLVAYYPVDGDLNTTLTDTKNAYNGTLEGTAEFDGRTNHAFGVRALRLKNTADGDVTVPNNPAFDFPGGNGTIEAIVYLEPSLSSGPETIIAECADGGSPLYYGIQVSADGTSLIYNNDSRTQPVSWGLPVPILGRQAHVALVFTSGTVTAYVDGLSLGTQASPSFGNTSGNPLYIGSLGLNTTSGGEFTGAIDEIALYSSALSANTIAVHNSKFIYGTNTSSPTITASPTGSKTLLAGGNVSFSVTASGTAPLTYQWTTNSVPIPGATASTLNLSPSTIAESGTYGVTVSNPYGSTNSTTFNVTFIAPPDRYATMVMNDNPLAYWRLDESSGTTAYDSAGGHDGAYSGSLTLGAGGVLPGISDSAVHFSGGNVQVPFSAALNPNHAFTVEFWASPDDINIYTPMCSQYRNGSARDGWCFYMENDADSWESHLGNSSGVSHYCYGGGGPLQANYFYHVVEIWDGTNTSTLYSEDKLVGQNTQVGLGGTYVPNPSAPLMIGVRNGGSFPFHGAIDEVAIYNYAFTYQQVTSHWSIKFAPASIVQSPVGVTNTEGSTVSMTVQAAGFPLTYQWYGPHGALSDIANPVDGTAHYPNDVTNATLTIAEATPSDSGQYHVVAISPLGNATSGNATVLITADNTPPTVTSVTALGTPNINGGTNAFLIKVGFSKRIDPTTASTPANYLLNPAVTINGITVASSLQAAAFGGDYRTAYLNTAGLTPGTKYSLTVSGVKDQAQTPNTVASTTSSFWSPIFTAGALWWDYYYPVTPQAVSSLLTILYNSNDPQTNATIHAFDTDLITGGDLNNNAAFGAAGDNYGDSLSGWITPTVSGEYYFFIASDDASQLWLSTDNNPLNIALIAQETSCCHGFQEPGAATTSGLISLTAGTPYFIQAMHTEGGGGDYVKVAWRLSTDTTGSTNLLAIGLSNTNDPASATYAPVLSSYAPVPAPAFGSTVLNNGQLTIPWSSYHNSGTILESSDLKTWTPVPGNPNPLVITVSSAPKMFYRVSQ